MSGFASIDDARSYQGHRLIVLENDRLRIEVMPGLGAKVFRFVHRASNVDLLWHNPCVEPREVPIGASYDDNFSGGWDELFPNDAAGRVGDEVYPDHGELWSQHWQYRVTHAEVDRVELYLRRACTVTTTIVEKWISLEAGASHARFRHRITNIGAKSLDFLWKMHPALAIDPGDRIDVPAAIGELVDPAFGRISEPREFSWPIAKPSSGAPVDFSVIPDLHNERDFLYARDLSAGWCALRRLRHGLGFGLAFPKETFRSVWLFMTYGGWRGLYTLVLEPCTSYPKDLNEAIRRGQYATLAPGAKLDCEVSAVLFEGSAPVRGIGLDGSVVR